MGVQLLGMLDLEARDTACTPHRGCAAHSRQVAVGIRVSNGGVHTARGWGRLEPQAQRKSTFAPTNSKVVLRALLRRHRAASRLLESNLCNHRKR